MRTQYTLFFITCITLSYQMECSDSQQRDTTKKAEVMLSIMNTYQAVPRNFKNQEPENFENNRIAANFAFHGIEKHDKVMFKWFVSPDNVNSYTYIHNSHSSLLSCIIRSLSGEHTKHSILTTTNDTPWYMAQVVINNKVHIDNPEEDHPFFECKSGDIEMPRLLIENGANINVYHSSQHILPARISDHPEMVHLLIEYGADFNNLHNILSRLRTDVDPAPIYKQLVFYADKLFDTQSQFNTQNLPHSDQEKMACARAQLGQQRLDDAETTLHATPHAKQRGHIVLHALRLRISCENRKKIIQRQLRYNLPTQATRDELEQELRNMDDKINTIQTWINTITHRNLHIDIRGALSEQKNSWRWYMTPSLELYAKQIQDLYPAHKMAQNSQFTDIDIFVIDQEEKKQ